MRPQMLVMTDSNTVLRALRAKDAISVGFLSHPLFVPASLTKCPIPFTGLSFHCAIPWRIAPSNFLSGKAVYHGDTSKAAALASVFCPRAFSPSCAWAQVVCSTAEVIFVGIFASCTFFERWHAIFLPFCRRV